MQTNTIDLLEILLAKMIGCVSGDGGHILGKKLMKLKIEVYMESIIVVILMM